MENAIKWTTAGLIFALITSIWTVQHSQYVKEQLQQHIITLVQHQFGVSFDCVVSDVNLFFPAITVTQLKTSPLESCAWSWHCSQLSFKCSWLDIILKKNILATVTIQDLVLRSVYANNTFAIAPHIERLFFMQGPFPLTLKRLHITQARSTIQDDDHNLELRLAWHSKSKRINNTLSSHIKIHDGSLQTPNGPLIEQIEAQLHQTIPGDVQLHGSCVLSAGIQTKTPCSLSCTWHNNQLSCKAQTDHTQIGYGPFQAYFDDIALQANGHYDSNGLHLLGKCSITGLHLNDHPLLKRASATFSYEQQEWRGTLHTHSSQEKTTEGAWHWNTHERTGAITHPWCTITWEPKTDGLETGYTITATHERYQATATLKDLAQQKELSLTCHEGHERTPCFAIRSESNNQTTIAIQYEFIRALLPEHIGRSLLGEGVITLVTNWNPSDKTISGHISLVDGTIMLANSYNPLKNCTGTFTIHPAQRTLAIHTINLLFYRGQATTTNGFISTQEITIPVQMQDLFFSIKNDALTSISGDLVIHKHAETPLGIQANLLLDRTQIKESVLTEELKREFNQLFNRSGNQRGPLATLDITLATKRPAHIKTRALESRAKINAHCTGTTQEPLCTGSLELVSGSIAFPYKHLDIVHGMIQCTPDRPHDPTISLVARNTVKHYSITMHITGSLFNPRITFDATPHLTEEQICALLLAGSERESLSMAMPSLVMQNVQSALLENAQQRAHVERYLHRIIEPLKHVRIVPHLAEDHHAGSMHGSVEIDINDRLQAIVQKDLSAPEEPKIELDYQLTDEISLRGIKDERGDLVGEVEMRWKF